MVVLTTQSDDVFHEAEELLRLFLGMTAVRAQEQEGGSVDYRITIDTHYEQGRWYAEARDELHDVPPQSASYPFLGDSPLLQRRARSRAVKFALFSLMKKLLPESYTPWGALTGIRPTKLLYEYISGGMQPVEAARILVRDYGVRQDKVAILLDIEQMQRGYRCSLKNYMLDVYIGIPFCPSRCEYCSFASCDVHKFGALREPYLEALFTEMRMMRAYMDECGLKTGNLYIGGGTPTALEDDQLVRLLKACRAFVPESGEFTLEAGRPDTITREKLAAAKEYGVSRLSINPQSMHDATLEKIGRKHRAQQIREAFALAREMGFHNINMDLIAGLSGETTEMFSSSLESVIDLAPENVTVHTLSIKRSSILHENLSENRPTPPEDVDRMVQDALHRLGAGGWRPYYLYRQKYMSGNLENVGYAKPGTQCLYNIDVMEETHSNLAMGAGAITKWFDPEANVIRRAANVKNVREYIDRCEQMAQKKIALAREMFPEE